MYKEIKFCDMSREALEQLIKGAFLTVRDGDRVNTMTIGWGSIGYIWNKPIFTALVRYSRHTYELIEKSKDFTISFPLNKTLNKELGICGTKSGRDIDKFKETGLLLRDGDKVASPIIDNCELHMECKLVYKQAMEESSLADEIKAKAYSNGDYHVMYFGEIVSTYIKE